MKLGICGNIDCDTVIKAADKAFKGYSAIQDEPPIIYYPKEYSTLVKKQNCIFRPVAFPLINIGIKIPKTLKDTNENRKMTVAMNILMSMLFSSSEFFNTDMYDRKIIVSSLQYEYVSDFTASYSYAVIEAEAKKPELFYKKFIEYLERLKKRGLSKKSFERTKRVYFAENIKNVKAETEEIVQDDDIPLPPPPPEEEELGLPSFETA